MKPDATIRYLSRADLESLGVTAADLVGPLREALATKNVDPAK